MEQADVGIGLIAFYAMGAIGFVVAFGYRRWAERRAKKSRAASLNEGVSIFDDASADGIIKGPW